LMKYQRLCYEILGEGRRRTQNKEILYTQEEELREQLVEEWGGLEKIFSRLGAPMIAVTPAVGYNELVFDEALSGEIHDNPRKYECLELAIQSATKAIGLLGACTDTELRKLFRKTPIFFISYSFRKKNEKLINTIQELLAAFYISIVTGEKPSTGSISEKVKRLIDDSDYILAVLKIRKQIKVGLLQNGFVMKWLLRWAGKKQLFCWLKMD
ncbi:MAG: hypothetical protein M1365_08680, partial [Actinobacteria bacterium]|nr:hypothetical protein [Actinomycetota bacterium]